MIRFPRALAAWPSDACREILRQEILALDAGLLPLQQGLARSSHALDRFTVLILDVTDAADCLRVKAGLCYAGIIAGCSCADDPTPVAEIPEYCVVRFDIDKATGQASVTLLPDQ